MKYVLTCLILATVLVQGIDSASFLVPSLKDFRSVLDTKNDQAQQDERAILNDDRESNEIAANQCILTYTQSFPFVEIDPNLFGSKVLYTDSDIGLALNRFSVDPSLCYWDVGLFYGEFDQGDVVYYHFNSTGSPIVGQNDIRLNGFEGHFPGSKVTAYDVDINKPLTAFPRESMVAFAGQSGSNRYELTDPIFYHLGDNSSQLAAGDLRMSYFAYGPAGTLVNGRDPDLGLPISKLTYRIRFYNINGNVGSNGEAIYDKMDPVYLDIGNENEPGFVTVNDVRLS